MNKQEVKVVWKLGEFYRYKTKTGKILSQNIIGVCTIKVYKKTDELPNEEFTFDSMVQSLLSSKTFCSVESSSSTKNKYKKEVTWQQSFEGEAVYKFSRIPHWGPFWEKRIYKVIKEYCPFLTNFVGVKMISCANLIHDQQGFALPKTVTSIYEKKARLVDLNIYDKIEGETLAIKIGKGFKKSNLSNVLQQVFAIQYMTQLYCEYTHYDMHCSNILLEPNQEFSWFYYKFNNQISVMIPSSGYRVKIIDLEFSHVGGLQGKNFDGRPDLFDLGYTPQRFDPEIDQVRLIMNAFSILKDFRNDQAPWTITRSFLKSIGTRPFDDKGLFIRSNDPLRTRIFEILKQGDLQFYKFVYKWYERLISYLFHFITIDERKLIKSNTKPNFVRFVTIDPETKETRITINSISNHDPWIKEMIEYFRFMYSFKPKGVIKPTEILCFIKIYDWIQHKKEDALTEQQKNLCMLFAKKLAKPTFDLYSEMTNVGFPLKDYNPFKNWIQWNLMKQTKNYETSLVFDPIVALDLVSTHLPTFQPEIKEKNVCIIAFDLNQEQSTSITKEQEEQLTAIVDPFQRASLFESFFQ